MVLMIKTNSTLIKLHTHRYLQRIDHRNGVGAGNTLNSGIATIKTPLVGNPSRGKGHRGSLLALDGIETLSPLAGKRSKNSPLVSHPRESDRALT
jgi:hypothetical protein